MSWSLAVNPGRGRGAAGIGDWGLGLMPLLQSLPRILGALLGFNPHPHSSQSPVPVNVETSLNFLRELPDCPSSFLMNVQCVILVAQMKRSQLKPAMPPFFVQPPQSGEVAQLSGSPKHRYRVLEYLEMTVAVRGHRVHQITDH